ncbi:hypothetical protein KGP36_06170 [Patescibacteria group bacterium]|nr:hypothetical protein [Patescibacteria group bacterium]
MLPYSPPFDPKNPPQGTMIVNLTTDGSNGDDNIDATGADVLVIFPENNTKPRTAQVFISNPSNVVVVGGELTMAGAIPTGGACFEVENASGEVFIEGLLISATGGNNDQQDAFQGASWVNSNGQKWTFQNVHIVGVSNSVPNSSNHPDCFQAYGYLNGRGEWGTVGECKFHNCSFYTGYQGVFADDNNHCHVKGPFLFSNTNIEASNDGNPTSYLFWLADGTNVSPPDWYPQAYIGPNVHCKAHTGQPLDKCIWTPGGTLQSNGDLVYTNNASVFPASHHPLMVNAGLSADEARFVSGHPSTGDYCPVANCGLNYVSPGYGSLSPTPAPAPIPVPAPTPEPAPAPTPVPTVNLDALLDGAFGIIAGTILVRDATGWKALPPGQPGQILTCFGPDQAPGWTTLSINITS